jgi:hypothetical protein
MDVDVAYIGVGKQPRDERLDRRPLAASAITEAPQRPEAALASTKAFLYTASIVMLRRMAVS